MSLTKNPEIHHKSKHIKIKYHYVREQVEAKSVVLVYVKSIAQIADGLTKPLGKILHSLFIKGLRLEDLLVNSTTAALAK